MFSEVFLQTHNLTCIKSCVSGKLYHNLLKCNNNYFYVIGHIPIVPLNFTVISNEGPFSRDSVELCVREILLSMSRCLFEKRLFSLISIKLGDCLHKIQK